jgi:hypothetical protein
LEQPWSNGQLEGQINRLKMLKRQMYGRANIKLLECRMGQCGMIIKSAEEPVSGAN